MGGDERRGAFLLSALMRHPGEVLEAARIDGAGYLETLIRIALPLSLPESTVMIFNITAWWNDLLIPLVFIGQAEKNGDRRRGDDRLAVQHGLPTCPHRAVPRLAAADHRPTSSCSATSGVVWCWVR